VAGVEIGPDSLRFFLADLDGRELGGATVALSPLSSTPAAVCTRIGKELRNLLRKHKQPEEQLLGLAAGVPAIVDVREGIVVSFSPLKGWRNVALGAMLRREFHCEVIVENDTNLAAQGEYYRGAAQGVENFVFVTVGAGVGAGIFVGGRIYHGSHWSAGEIGYLRVPSISRGNPTIHGRGRLEKVLGASGILRSWRAGSQRRRHPKVTHASEVFDLATAGNAQAKYILKQRASILADIVLDLSLILNPSVILLGGDVGNHTRLLQEVNALLEGSEFAVERVKLGALGSSAVLWGAISTVLDSAILSLIQAS